MNATHDIVRLENMTSAASAQVLDRPAAPRYAVSRSASLARPTLSIAAFSSARHSRAVRLSWVGLVRR